jgi:teichuronic acid biosynthesis glycosyltransferase TuaC
MHLLFVTQESGKIPSGVITVLDHLCQCWPESDGITILMNPTHWHGAELQQRLTKKNLDFESVPFLLSDDWINNGVSQLPRAFRILIRITLLPFVVLQSLLLLVWLIVWMRKNNISGILSHNGGWPGGRLNRWVIYAGYLALVPERVLVIHNTPQISGFFIRKYFSNFSGRLIGWLATRIVTVSRACRERLELKGEFGRSLEVIYNGIHNTPRTSSEYSMETLPWGKKHPTIAFIGELHPRKGVHVLLEALQSVDTECELVLIGNGTPVYTAEIKAMASQLNHPVIFLGFRDDVQMLYRWIDVLVLPSLNFESFGMVIIEAMRAGVSVICSDFGGMKEVVADGETGFVVPAGDSHALANAIDRLLRDEGLRIRMGESGRRRMEKRFSSSTMTENYVRLFHSL